MRKKKILSMVGIVLATILLVGVVFGVLMSIKGGDEPDQTETQDNSSKLPDTNSDTNIGFDTSEGNKVIDFENGNEKYLDGKLIGYLERMEKGSLEVDEQGNYLLDKDGNLRYSSCNDENFEPVMDNLIMLINQMATDGYSEFASHQMQRFYINYYNLFVGQTFEEVYRKLSICFPKNGTSVDNLEKNVLEQFGFTNSEHFKCIFDPDEEAKPKVEFYNVLPNKVEISEDLKALSIYDNWKNPEDDGYERNLESWLENVMKVTKDAGLSDEKIMVAEILYAGTLVNAEYRSDWDEALIRCMTVENWNFETVKEQVLTEFQVDISDNVPLADYFAEVTA